MIDFYYRLPVNINLKSLTQNEVTMLSDTPDSLPDNPNSYNGFAMVMPVKLRIPDGEFWTFPVEPLVGISGGNIIAKRTVAKGKTTGKQARGTIKERWTQDDYAITIEGVLINMDNANVYPEEDVKKLREFCETHESLDIECELLRIHDISRICITNWDLPFTKGDANQRFTISALSDDLFELLVEDTKPLT